MDEDVVQCQLLSLLLSFDFHPLTCKHSGKFSWSNSRTNSLLPSTTVCYSECPIPAASPLRVALQPLEIPFCCPMRLKGSEQVTSDFSKSNRVSPCLPHFGILHFDHLPLLESCPFLGFLKLLPLPDDPSPSVYLCM